MEKFGPILTICLASISIVIINKVWRKRSQDPKYDSDKPQKNFKKYIRNNLKDNTQDFYTLEDLKRITQKIEQLDIESLCEPLPNLQLTPFIEDKFEYIEEEIGLQRLVQDIQENSRAIGVDIEQTNLNSYQGYICLIQISTVNKNYIIDAIMLHDILPQYLKPIFENEKIVKIFCSGTSDLQWLSRDFGVFVVNFFDVHNARVFLDKHKDSSLIGLLDEFCGVKIDKATKKKFQVSDWRIRPLSREQLNYAILDSHYLIYLRNILLERIKLTKKKESMSSFIRQMQANCLKVYEMKLFNKIPFIEHFNQEIASYMKKSKKLTKDDQKTNWNKEQKTFITLCQIRDKIAREEDCPPDHICSLKVLFEITVKFSNPEDLNDLNSIHKEYEVDSKYVEEMARVLKGEIPLLDLTDVSSSNKKGPDTKEEQKIIRQKFYEEKLTLKKNLYENCQVLAPDGELLSFTNTSKVKWYLSRGLADLVNENPMTIKLRFEPAGRGTSDMAEFNICRQDYMQRTRLNQCVVCGNIEKLSRFHVVPSLYRQYFPEQLKSHRAHDVVLMCFRCREKANTESDKQKVEIAKRFNVSLIQFEKPQELKLTVQSIQNTLSAYLKYKNAMPKERRKKLKQAIREAFIAFSSDPELSQEARKGISTFKYKEDGRLKIDEGFISYFKNLKDYKTLVTVNSNKEFRNIHGKLVVEKLLQTNQLKSFIEDWRMFFLNSMDPQFLPHDWNLVIAARAKLKANKDKDKDG